MQVAIFLCNNNTMGECLKKNLFGIGVPYGRQVRKGDLLFLYNYSDNHLYGIWIAETNGGTYDPLAWGGRYRNQVRISQSSRVLMNFPKYCFNEILGKGVNIGQILHGYKAQNLVQYFENKYTIEKELGITINAIEEDYRDKYPTNFMCEDGHRVRSTHEKIVDDWLYKHRVPHAYEPILDLPGQLIPDFAVHRANGEPVYIENWSMINSPLYEKRRLHKSKLYAEYRLPLIELEPQHLHSIDSNLATKLRQCNIPFV